jgi:hypothetical protein
MRFSKLPPIDSGTCANSGVADHVKSLLRTIAREFLLIRSSRSARSVIIWDEPSTSLRGLRIAQREDEPSIDDHANVAFRSTRLALCRHQINGLTAPSVLQQRSLITVPILQMYLPLHLFLNSHSGPATRPAATAKQHTSHHIRTMPTYVI